MLLSVRVVPKSSRVLVKQEGQLYKVYLTKPAEDGLANEQLLEVLAGHLNIKRYRLEIAKGHKSRNKIVRINE